MQNYATLYDPKDIEKCHDCKKEIVIENEEVVNGKILVYWDNGDKIVVAKCNECYNKNKSLDHFRQCEVYSRVVGYLRPINQWNEGKKREYKERKSYQLKP